MNNSSKFAICQKSDGYTFVIMSGRDEEVAHLDDDDTIVLHRSRLTLEEMLYVVRLIESEMK